jgi:hypothetical protein
MEITPPLTLEVLLDILQSVRVIIEPPERDIHPPLSVTLFDLIIVPVKLASALEIA